MCPNARPAASQLFSDVSDETVDHLPPPWHRLRCRVQQGGQHSIRRVSCRFTQVRNVRPPFAWTEHAAHGFSGERSSPRSKINRRRSCGPIGETTAAECVGGRLLNANDDGCVDSGRSSREARPRHHSKAWPFSFVFGRLARLGEQTRLVRQRHPGICVVSEFIDGACIYTFRSTAPVGECPGLCSLILW